MAKRKRATPARRNQPRLPNGRRQSIAAAVAHDIERALEREMRRFGVSRSFVVAVALAYTFGIDLDETADYRKGKR
jgi:hypothetical protein